MCRPVDFPSMFTLAPSTPDWCKLSFLQNFITCVTFPSELDFHPWPSFKYSRLCLVVIVHAQYLEYEVIHEQQSESIRLQFNIWLITFYLHVNASILFQPNLVSATTNMVRHSCVASSISRPNFKKVIFLLSRYESVSITSVYTFCWQRGTLTWYSCFLLHVEYLEQSQPSLK